MTQTAEMMRVFTLGAAFVLGASTASHAQVANNKSLKKAPVTDTSVDSNALSPQIQLKLADGSRITVEDAWESEQGIWYKQSGVTHLIGRDRVKGIERKAKSKVEPPVVQITDTSGTKVTTSLQPVWIHLVGGARVEADSATESAAGVWYTRGALSVFIERSRIDHIERENLESLAESESSSRKERGWTTGRRQIDALIRQNAAKVGLDPYLVFCVMEQESHFNSRAESPQGARGLMQLMPGTAARFGVRKSFDPAQNIAGGTRFLKQLSQRFNGRVDLILASYNAGEGAVMKYGRKVPPYRETRNYVKRISYRYHRGKAPVASAQGNISTAGGS
jgi:hypothetical protein